MARCVDIAGPSVYHAKVLLAGQGGAKESLRFPGYRAIQMLNSRMSIRTSRWCVCDRSPDLAGMGHRAKVDNMMVFWLSRDLVAASVCKIFAASHIV